MRVAPERRMVDVRALWTFGEAGQAIMDTMTSGRVAYMVDTEEMTATISWPMHAVVNGDPVNILGSLGSGIDTARKYNDDGMYQRPWNHAETTHMEERAGYYVTTFAIVPDTEV